VARVLALAAGLAGTGHAWQKVPGAGGSAGPRQGHAMAYHATRQRVAVFSSLGLAEWNGSVWNSPGASGPAGRDHAQLAYDPMRDQLVLYGGLSSDTSTWLWNANGTWTQRAVAGPGIQDSHAMAWHPGRGTVVLLRPGSAWEWNGSAWSTFGASHPTVRPNTLTTHPPSLALVGVCGNQRCDLSSGGTWTYPLDIVSGASVTLGATAMAYSSRSPGNFVMHGWIFDSEANTATEHIFIDFAPNGTPLPSRESTALTYDAARGQLVLYGGRAPGGGALDDTWLSPGYGFCDAFCTSSGGHCVEGGCCREASCGICRSCKTGWCEPVVNDVDDSCTGGSYCDAGASCVPKRANGQPCSVDAACQSGRCRDGVCCSSECSGACVNCANPTGTCQDVRSAPNPGHCAGTHACDAQGNCKLVNGQSCGADATLCASGFCRDTKCCNAACGGLCDWCGTGICTPGAGGGSCGLYQCQPGNSNCPTSCTADTQCTGNGYCRADGTCQSRKGNGSTCPAADCAEPGCRQCLGPCVEGLCCNSLCTGACESCLAARSTGANGTCSPAKAGEPGAPPCSPTACDGSARGCPGTNACSGDAQCAQTHFCAQGGTCQPRRAKGLSCNLAVDCRQPNCRECASAGGCVEGVCCDAACDGPCDLCNGPSLGSCVPAPAGFAACGPYVCDGASAQCPTACTSTSQCALGHECIAGTCTVKLVNGEACQDAAQCRSGFCVDGRCCESACAGDCRSCALPGLLGTCSGAPAGSDPRGRCGEAGCSIGCGSDGSCVRESPGTACEVCRTCDGDGRCSQSPPDGRDGRCSPVACSLLDTACRAYQDIGAMCLGPGLCASLSDPAACSQFRDAPDGTACPGGACAGGVCAAAPPDGAPGCGDCAATGRPAAPGGVALLLLFIALIAPVARRRRSPSSPRSRRARPRRRC
jgi:hypothetical protein